MLRLSTLVFATFAMPMIAMAQSATMYKTPWCGCCAGHAAYLEDEEFDVEIVETSAEELADLKDRYAIPAGQRGCHTLVIDGYAVEGHVPAEAIRKLLETRPEITGITLPGMPAGSPGMNGEKSAPFKVEIIGQSAQTFMEL